MLHCTVFSIQMVYSRKTKLRYKMTKKRPTNDPLTPLKISGHPVLRGDWRFRTAIVWSRDTHMLPPSPLPLSHCTDLSPSSAKKNTEKTQFSPHSPIFRINLRILLLLVLLLLLLLVTTVSKTKESPESRCTAVDLQKLLPLSSAAGWNCHSTGLLRSNSIFIVNVIFRIIDTILKINAVVPS